MSSPKSEKSTTPISPASVSDTAILKVAKEVVIKFIEIGRLSPGNFAETFDDIHSAVYNTVKKTDGEKDS